MQVSTKGREGRGGGGRIYRSALTLSSGVPRAWTCRMSQQYVFLLGRRDSHLLPLSSPAPRPPPPHRLLPCGLTSNAPLSPSPPRLLLGGFDAKCTMPPPSLLPPQTAPVWLDVKSVFQPGHHHTSHHSHQPLLSPSPHRLLPGGFDAKCTVDTIPTNRCSPFPSPSPPPQTAPGRI